MKDAAVKTRNELLQAREELARESYPAFDELMAYSLERRHLDIPEISEILMTDFEGSSGISTLNHLKDNVRLFKIEELSFDNEDKLHLPSVESAITSMRGRGYSLIFLVHGETTKTTIYLGLSRFNAKPQGINEALDSYAAVWKANFPGSEMITLTTEEINKIAYDFKGCSNVGVLTGIPSLKRKEDSNLFVQGLERLIRGMRGKNYCWLSIADPISQEALTDVVDACQHLQSDIHHLIHTALSKATSSGKTVMLGMFGMRGGGTTDGMSHSYSGSKTGTNNQVFMEKYQQISPLASVAGTVVGACFGGPLGAMVGGTVAGGLVNGVGSLLSGGKSGHSNSVSETQGWADTTSHSLSSQQALGGFGSFGLTWTKTTTVGQELLNRKAEWVEESLKKYEERLREGMAIGMWNLCHYFMADTENSYNQGIGIVTSLFSGMDSLYEPPRTIKMPTSFLNALQRFNNVYLRFSNDKLVQRDLNNGQADLKDHPLGIIYNGPATPVNTRELAIATPIATQDVEGVSVVRRSSFGLNIPIERKKELSLTLGSVLDRGNSTYQKYRLSLDNLPKHLAIFGLTGSGKTNTVHHLLGQLWKNNHIPFLVIEPAKTEYRALAEMPELAEDMLVISAGIDHTSVCPLRLNPFDFEPGLDNDANRVHLLTHIDRLKATFNASFPMYASMPYILEEAILEVYKERGWDLGRSRNRYVDIYNEDFHEYIPTLQDLYLKVSKIVRKKGYYQEQQMNIEAALKARLSSLMVGAKGNMLNCVQSISAHNLFTRPVVIELENLGDDDEKAFLMALLVSKLYEFRKATFKGKEDNNKIPKHILVVEEAHRLLANVPDTSANQDSANVKGKAVSTFVDMLAEIRSLGESVFVVDQLPSRVSPNVVKGTGTKIIHRLLAKDDRESVGWTMAMEGGQISELSQLHTGECVVNQDGDRKSYMCHIPKNDYHENLTGCELALGTMTFKKEHGNLFVNNSDDIDKEDVKLRNELTKVMLAIGIGEDVTDICLLCVPTRRIGWGKDDKYLWLSEYWKQICQELWSFHESGDFNLYLDLYKEGLSLIAGKKDTKGYRLAYSAYLESTKTYKCSAAISIIGVAYDILFMRFDTIANINRYFDQESNYSNKLDRLAVAIARSLDSLLPAKASNNLKRIVVEEILQRIPAKIDANYIMGKLNI